jgi:DNA-binding response OmpR family regulator
MARRTKILIVEDDATISGGLKDLLEAEGYSASVAPDGVSGLAQVFRLHPDLLLLDINLPGLTGIEVCRKARDGGFTNPVIVLSARADGTDKIIGFESGADDYVAKPFDPREILARVRAQLRRLERPGTDATTGVSPGESESGHRRLQAIMFTDIKDFSRTMNASEKLALAKLASHNRILTREILRKNGRIIEIIGDAFLASFESALNAVECALAVQQALTRFNDRKRPGEQINVRIGIHLGDVVELHGKVRGDAVNIAARLQELAVPGKINISSGVFESVKGRLSLHSRRLGSRRVKNIKQPVTIYRVSV